MLKQFISSEYCLKCDTCCRFGQKNSAYAPKFLADETIRLGDRFIQTAILRKNLSPSCGAAYACHYFSPSTNSCNIYSTRPLDCQLYPLMVTYDKEYENIILCLDTKCPYVKQTGTVPSRQLLSHRDCPHLLTNLPHSFVMPYQPDTIKITTIKNLGGFKALALEHKPLFEKYLNVGANNYSPLQLSTRSFVNIYIWSDLFNILWKIIGGNLCVYYEYKNELNMMMPPIAKDDDVGAGLKPAPTFVGRVENIAENEIEIFKNLGLKIYKNTNEYIYLAKDIAELKGNKYASQRAALNHFVKNNKFTYRPFVIDDTDECLELYAGWAKQKKNKDSVYQQLISDSFSAQKKAMLNFEELGLTGMVIDIAGKICAYTFAFKMNTGAYCVIFETADINIKGLAQFIFSRFAQDLAKDAKYINAMDDSGLATLRRTKLLWHPHKILTNYLGVKN